MRILDFAQSGQQVAQPLRRPKSHIFADLQFFNFAVYDFTILQFCYFEVL